MDRPVPKDDEVLIEVHATTLSPADCAFRSGKPFIARFFTGGLTRPTLVPGFELAGKIEAVGKDVKKFKAGDRVFGVSGARRGGAQAEYALLGEEDAMAIIPLKLSYGEAAALCDGALTALPFLRDRGKVQSGQSVLINGASGSIGTMAVQLAKHFGAEVTGVCGASNLELVRSLGADQVIDYTKQDFTKDGKEYDIIFDAVGKTKFSQCKGALKVGGIYLTTVPTMAVMLRMLWPSRLAHKRARFAATGMRPPGDKAKDLAFLINLIEAGKLRVVLDRRCPLERIAEAHRYVERGHKRGSLVIIVREDA
jgi:NADPH:quinone reductase-like Zn-dependent oxidoreductase